MVNYDVGDYVAEVTDQALVESSTGKPMIVLKVRVSSQLIGAGGNREELRETDTYERTIRLVVNQGSQKSMDFLLKKLRYAGFVDDSFSSMDLVGAVVRCSCKHGVYKGEPNEEWDLMLPPLAPLEHNPSLSKKIDALFGKSLKVSVPATADAALVATTGVVSIDKDEIPF